MRTIGMLGGMAWPSTELYYRLANQLVAARLGAPHSARIALVSVDFAEVEAMQRAGDWDAAGVLLAAAARRVEAAGADLLVLCTNTMHVVAPRLEAAIAIPLLHIADVTAAAAGETRTVGLLGTAYTMEQPFLRDRLASHGLEVLVPDAAGRALVHRTIYDELVGGIVREESRDAFREVVARLVGRGAEAIVLGCTEVELLVGAADSPVPVLPTTRLHVEAAVRAALA